MLLLRDQNEGASWGERKCFGMFIHVGKLGNTVATVNDTL